MKIKTSELTGDALNYAFAISEGGEDGYADEKEHALYLLTDPSHKGTLDFHPHTVDDMRCYVASKLGDEVDIPQELLGEVT
jgi:hypothetical protein